MQLIAPIHCYGIKPNFHVSNSSIVPCPFNMHSTHITYTGFFFLFLCFFPDQPLMSRLQLLYVNVYDASSWSIQHRNQVACIIFRNTCSKFGLEIQSGTHPQKWRMTKIQWLLDADWQTGDANKSDKVDKWAVVTDVVVRNDSNIRQKEYEKKEVPGAWENW